MSAGVGQLKPTAGSLRAVVFVGCVLTLLLGCGNDSNEETKAIQVADRILRFLVENPAREKVIE